MPQWLPGLEGCAAGALTLPGPVAAGAARGGFGQTGVCEKEACSGASAPLVSGPLAAGLIAEAHPTSIVLERR